MASEKSDRILAEKNKAETHKKKHPGKRGAFFVDISLPGGLYCSP
jgi:hypothetical protein